MIGGAVIASALLGQFYINEHIGKVPKFVPAWKKITSYFFRAIGAIISFAVLVFVIRLIRLFTIVTVPNVVAIAIGLLVTVFWGLKIIKKK
jgi:uncharacterized protein HemY